MESKAQRHAPHVAVFEKKIFEKQISDALHQTGIQHPDVPVLLSKRPKGRFTLSQLPRKADL